MKVLYVDACVRRETSRTELLAQSLLKAIGGEVSAVILEDVDLRPHHEGELAERAASAAKGDFDEDCFRLGGQFRDCLLYTSPSPRDTR